MNIHPSFSSKASFSNGASPNNKSKNKSSGFTLLEVLLAIGVSLSVGAVALNELRQRNESAQARAVGQQLKTVGDAMNTYIALHYTNIVSLTDVVGVGSAADPGPRDCTAAVAGTVPANSAICTINVNTLIRNGLLPTSFSGRNAYGSEYGFYIRVSGSAPNWIVEGLVVTTEPYTTGAGPRYDLLGQAMQEAGADSGMTRSLANRLEGLNGTWADQGWPAFTDNLTGAATNHAGVNELGLLGYRVGYGSSGFAAFVRLDGTVPMTGNLDMGGNSIVDVQDIDASGTVSALRLRATGTGGQALTLNDGGTNGPNRTDFATGAGTLAIRNANGVAFQNLDGSGFVNISARDVTARNVSANGDVSASGVISATQLNSTTRVSALTDVEAGRDLIVVRNGRFGGNVQVGGAGTGDLTVGGSILATNVAATNQVTASGGFGFVSTGNTGWYNSTHGGGFYMNDPTWIRVFNDRNIFTAGTMRAGNLVADQNVNIGGALIIDGSAASTVTLGAVCTENASLRRSTAGLLAYCDNVGGARTWRKVGVDGVQQVSSGVIAAPGAGPGTVTGSANCPASTRLVGGGYRLVNHIPVGGGQDAPAPDASFPNGNQWQINLSRLQGNSTFRAYALCIQ